MDYMNGLSATDWVTLSEMLRTGKTQMLSWYKPSRDERLTLNALRGVYGDYLDYQKDTYLYVYGDNNHLAIPVFYGSATAHNGWGRKGTMMVLHFFGPDGLEWTAHVYESTGHTRCQRLKKQKGQIVDGLFCWVYDYDGPEAPAHRTRELSRYVRYG